MTCGTFDVLKECIHGFRSPEDDAALQRHRNAVARIMMIPRVSGINHESMPLIPLRRPISGDSVWSLQVGLHLSAVLLATLKALSPSILSHVPKENGSFLRTRGGPLSGLTSPASAVNSSSPFSVQNSIQGEEGEPSPTLSVNSLPVLSKDPDNKYIRKPL
jgi:hypothetical protein